MKIYIASDHAGFDYKNKILNHLFQNFENFEINDLGPATESSVDYPDFANQVSHNLVGTTSKEALGILICGSGQGMALRANKYLHIRAALVYNEEIARLSREHNDANIICLGSKFCSIEDAEIWIKIFIKTQFSEGRHTLRVAKIAGSIDTI